MGPNLVDHEDSTKIIGIYFQNVDGFLRGCNGLDILDYFSEMKSIGTNIIGINKPNLSLCCPYICYLFYQHQ